MSKCSTSAVLPRPVTMQNCSIPAARASSTAYWISGLSTTGSISFAIALVAGRKRVPRPATGSTALRSGLITAADPLSQSLEGPEQSVARSVACRFGAGKQPAHPARWQRRTRPQQQSCVNHPSSTSRAWLIRAASQSDPPWSGCAPRISRRCAARISARRRPGCRPSTSIRLLPAHRAAGPRALRAGATPGGARGRACPPAPSSRSAAQAGSAPRARSPPRPVRNSSTASSSPPIATTHRPNCLSVATYARAEGAQHRQQQPRDVASPSSRKIIAAVSRRLAARAPRAPAPAAPPPR